MQVEWTVVKSKIGNVVVGPEIRTRTMVVQQKTGRPVQFELTSDARTSLFAWLERRGGTVDYYAFPSRIDRVAHLNTRQYAVSSASGSRRSAFDPRNTARTPAPHQGVHHLQGDRKPASHPDPVWNIKIDNTVRYLGVDVEDALELAEGTDIKFQEPFSHA